MSHAGGDRATLRYFEFRTEKKADEIMKGVSGM
jgi:hypothetical protein